MGIVNQELTEKLAKWAGVNIRPAPDFPQSLDACLFWLLPKLVGTTEIILHHEPDSQWDATLFGMKGNRTDIEISAESPALALCKAIEKLIDAEKVED